MINPVAIAGNADTAAFIGYIACQHVCVLPPAKRIVYYLPLWQHAWPQNRRKPYGIVKVQGILKAKTSPRLVNHGRIEMNVQICQINLVKMGTIDSTKRREAC